MGLNSTKAKLFLELLSSSINIRTIFHLHMSLMTTIIISYFFLGPIAPPGTGVLAIQSASGNLVSTIIAVLVSMKARAQYERR